MTISQTDVYMYIMYSI